MIGTLTSILILALFNDSIIHQLISKNYKILKFKCTSPSLYPVCFYRNLALLTFNQPCLFSHNIKSFLNCERINIRTWIPRRTSDGITLETEFKEFEPGLAELLTAGSNLNHRFKSFLEL